MASPERFTSMAAVRAAQVRLRTERQAHMAALKVYREHLGDPHFRKAVISKTLYRVTWKWLGNKRMSPWLAGAVGLAGVLGGWYLSSRKKGSAQEGSGTSITNILGMIMPLIMNLIGDRGGELLQGFTRSWRREHGEAPEEA